MKIKPTLALLVTICIYGCASNGHYSYQKASTQNKNIIVYGNTYDVNTRKPLAAVIISGYDKGNKVQTDKDGKYKLYVSEGRQRLKASWLGYYNNLTNQLKLAPGDSIQVNFFMKEDNRPLY